MKIVVGSHLLSRYETDSEVTQLINTRRLILIPTLNPDALEGLPGVSAPLDANSTNKEGVDLDSAFLPTLPGLFFIVLVLCVVDAAFGKCFLVWPNTLDLN